MRGAPWHVGRGERVVRRRPDEVAALSVLVEEDVDAPGLAAAGDELARCGPQLVEQEGAVLVGPETADHGGAVAEARQRVGGVRRLPAAGARGGHVRQRLVEGPAHVLAHLLLETGRPELVPEGEAVGQAVDEIEVEGAAADEVDRPHSASSPR